MTFFTGLASEFQKIEWPGAGEALGHAALVIVVAFAVGYYLGALDALFATLLRLLIS